jgi:hypothetical protein
VIVSLAVAPGVDAVDPFWPLSTTNANSSSGVSSVWWRLASIWAVVAAL